MHLKGGHSIPVYKFKANNKWFVRINYKDNKGKYKQLQRGYYDTRKEAQEAEARLLIEHGEAQGGNYTFKEISDELLEDMKPNMAPRGYDKLAIKCRHVNEYLGDIKINKLTIPQYKRFINGLRDSGYAIDYCNVIIATAKRIVKFANKRYGVSSSIPEAFDYFKDTSKTPKNDYTVYTPDQFRTFISVIDDIRFRTLFMTLYYTGMRIGEADALTWKDYSSKTLSINKSIDARKKEKVIGPPKTKSSYRTIPIPDKLDKELRELKTYWRKADSFSEDWFIFGGLRTLPNNTIQKKKHEYYLRATKIDPTLPEIRIHDFRHSFASLCITQLNLPVTTVSKMLGHESPAITLSVYSHFYKEKLTEAAEKLNEI